MTDRGGPLLAAAQGGDEDAFGELVRPYRPELHAHGYRMLGSVQDAEDVLQEVLLRAWRGLAAFEGRSSLRSWLYRISTNACLNAIESRSRRALPADLGPPSDAGSAPAGEPLVESVWIEPYRDTPAAVPDGLASPEARYEQRESVELAFVAALQHLPGNQRAVMARIQGNFGLFLGHMLWWITNYRPDVEALRAASARIVVAGGTDSAGQVAHRTAVALADLLGTTMVDFPGDHGGFVAKPAAFAQTLRRVLTGTA